MLNYVVYAFLPRSIPKKLSLLYWENRMIIRIELPLTFLKSYKKTWNYYLPKYATISPKKKQNDQKEMALKRTKNNNTNFFNQAILWANGNISHETQTLKLVLSINKFSRMREKKKKMVSVS